MRHSGGPAAYRYREIIFHSASLPGNAALEASTSLFPGETEKYMSCPRNVRIVGAILLALPATVWGFYVLAVLFVICGLPRLFVPERSVRLQQRSYPRRVHGVPL